MSELFVAPRMVLSGAGVDHDELVAYASEFFKDLPVAPRTPDRVRAWGKQRENVQREDGL